MSPHHNLRGRAPSTFSTVSSPPDTRSSSSVHGLRDFSSSPPFPQASPGNLSMSTTSLSAYRQPRSSRHSRKICSKKYAFSIFAAFILVLIAIFWHHHAVSSLAKLVQMHPSSHHQVVSQPATKSTTNRKQEPEAWLRKHTTTDYDTPVHTSSHRPKAALISLVRNEELEGILQSMRQLEYTWNRRYRYPWIFFSETPFNEEFKNATTHATSSRTSYNLIPPPHWSTPSFINTTLHHDSLTYLGSLSVGKGHLLSYRHMCRWNSGFFYLHPALADYDYYWRVEPDVQFFCQLGYDVFQFMADMKLVYGFNMNILEDARSFVSLWKLTVRFFEENMGYVHPDADWSWLVDEESDTAAELGTGAGGYNNCQFFSNFEIGDLRFFRSEGYQAYFRYLDEMGGFFYERFGDAPIHTLAVSLLAGRGEVWFFRDVGYQHDQARHCPMDAGEGGGRCMCEPTRLDENFYKLVPMESPQRKPKDTCIRLWLGGEWLRKKEGWKAEVERLLGGDGFGGYLRD